MKHNTIPKQTQNGQPGDEYKMNPQPEYIRSDYKGSEKLKNKTVLITGGDSGIGRSAAVHLAREGADISIIYYDEDKDAKETQQLVEQENRKCILIKGDIKDEEFCEKAVELTVSSLGKLDCLINNAAMQFPKESPEDLRLDDVKTTFETNIFPFFYLLKPCLQHLKSGSTIINTGSVTAYRGSHHLIDYASTKGAITSFTRSLAKALADKNIRVNGVAPGPIWTPLIPATFDKDRVAEFGKNVPLGRPGQPSECGPAYVFLASEDSSYITGQFIHINGGEIIGS